jgi:hypothetical protein
MGLIRIDACCGPKTAKTDSKTFFFAGSGEVVITAEEHGFTRMPNVTVYDSVGHEIEPEVQVDEETFDVTIRQESPVVAIYIALN